MKNLLLAKSACIFIITLSGCNAHLYNQGKYDLAKKASETFEAVDLTNSITREYDLLDTLLIQELAMAEKLTIARRDARLWKIISAHDEANSVKYLKEQIDLRLDEIVGGESIATELITKQSDIVSAEKALRDVMVTYQIARKPDDPQAACPSGEAGSPTFSGENSISRKIAYDFMIQNCDKLDEAKKALSDVAVQNGKLQVLTTEISAIEAAKEEIKKLVNENKTALNEKKAEFTEEENPSTSAAVAAELKETINGIELKDKLDKVKIPKGFENFKVIAPLEKLSQVDSAVNMLLDMVIENPDTVNDALSQETKLLLEMASTMNKFEDHINSLEFPQVSKILLESEMLSIKIKSLEDQRNIAEQKLSLMKEKSEHLKTEMSLLIKAKDNVDKLVALKKGESYMAIINSKDARAKELASYGLAYYATSWTMGRQEQEAVDYQLIHLDHVNTLNASSAALRQWNSLIKVPLNQMLVWEAHGIKPQHISGLIQALGFGGLIYANLTN